VRTIYILGTNFPAVRVYFQQSVDDAALVQRCLAGDTAAFEALVAEYQRLAFTVALRMLGDYEDARDATQTTFVKAFEKLDTYEPRYRFFSWLYRILVNECLNIRRGRRPVEELSAEQPSTENTRDGVESEERRRDVRVALLALPVHYREVIVLRHFAQMSYEEMSVATGVPVKTVKSRLHTARHQLMDLLRAWAVRR
jgi:RNA polymerase sigma-70 factor, ECF subfamily